VGWTFVTSSDIVELKVVCRESSGVYVWIFVCAVSGGDPFVALATC
jgi:hypothetical protein